MPHHITLIQTTLAHIETLYLFQLDKEGQYLAAFMPKEANEKEAYIKKYNAILNNPTITMRTILHNNNIVGSIAKFVLEGDNEITYWIDKQFWGKGIATAALQEFLKIVPDRPIFGRVAFDNYGSQKVLEKCNFKKIGTDKGYASARKMEIEEYIYKLA